MKALAILKYGGPEQLKVIETALPKPGRREVLVRVHAAGVNPVDYKIRNGSIKWLTGNKFPKILGGDVAGVVEQADNNSVYKPGDRVFAMLDFKGGAYAEFVVVKEDWLCHIPEVISMEDAAATPLAALTALQGLRKGGEIKPDQKVLINGASGGVGSYAVQIAKAWGAHVTAVCSARNLEFVQELGADEVIDYSTDDFTASDQKYYKVFDAVAKSSFGKCKKIIENGGIYISTIPGPGIMLQKAFNFLRKKNATAIMAKPSGTDLTLIADMMNKGIVRAYVEKTFSLQQGAEAHKMIETERVRGKIILKIIS